MNVKKVVNLFAATILIAIGWISAAIARSYSIIISGQSAVLQLENSNEAYALAMFMQDYSGIFVVLGTLVVLFGVFYAAYIAIYT